MSSFRFNFSLNDNSNETSPDAIESVQWLESEEVLTDEILKSFDDEKIRAKMFICGEIEIGHVVPSTALSNIEKADIKNTIDLADKAQSDLVTGIYEGGLKIWECTYDVVEFFEQQDDFDFQDKDVLDLGCGAGILGIYAFINGSRVTFQDYNKEVLKFVTIPNVLLNIEDEKESELSRCKFYSGDWESFNNKILKTNLYDIIVTSETIYNENNYDKFIKLIVDRLKKDGTAYVGAKTHYFGVGGGVRQFEQALQRNGLLKSEVIWKSTNGLQREILKVTHNKP